MKRTLITLAACLIFASCTNEDKTVRILEAEGYTNIEITGYRAFMCGENDTYSTGFKATNKNGNNVTGVVCGGFAKGYTIRYD